MDISYERLKNREWLGKNRKMLNVQGKISIIKRKNVGNTRG